MPEPKYIAAEFNQSVYAYSDQDRRELPTGWKEMKKAEEVRELFPSFQRF